MARRKRRNFAAEEQQSKTNQAVNELIEVHGVESVKRAVENAQKAVQLIEERKTLNFRQHNIAFQLTSIGADFDVRVPVQIQRAKRS